MAEGSLHARPEYDKDIHEDDIQRTIRHFDYPSDESLIPAYGTLLTGTDTLGYSLVEILSVPDPKSVQGRRRLLALTYERTIYVGS